MPMRALAQTSRDDLRVLFVIIELIVAAEQTKESCG